jgi:hypothetical protein
MLAAATANPRKVVDMDSFAGVSLLGSICRNGKNAKAARKYSQRKSRQAGLSD